MKLNVLYLPYLTVRIKNWGTTEGQKIRSRSWGFFHKLPKTYEDLSNHLQDHGIY